MSELTTWFVNIIFSFEAMLTQEDTTSREPDDIIEVLNVLNN